MPNHIDHPVHYTQGIECIDYIDSHKMDYLEGNIIKYVTRYKFKGGVDDLRKAEWYLKRLLKREAGCVCDHPERGICSGEATERVMTAAEIDEWSAQDCAKPFTLVDLEKEHHDEVVRETAQAMREVEDAYCLGDYKRPELFRGKLWINE